MTVPSTDPILRQPISDLEFSDEFKRVTKALYYYTLSGLVATRTFDLSRKPGFTLALIYEYVSFMEVRGLGELVDP